MNFKTFVAATEKLQSMCISKVNHLLMANTKESKSSCLFFLSVQAENHLGICVSRSQVTCDWHSDYRAAKEMFLYVRIKMNIIP